jgi:hypothetical protein
LRLGVLKLFELDHCPKEGLLVTRHGEMMLRLMVGVGMGFERCDCNGGTLEKAVFRDTMGELWKKPLSCAIHS